jgi:hypothetical protein
VDVQKNADIIEMRVLVIGKFFVGIVENRDIIVEVVEIL